MIARLLSRFRRPRRAQGREGGPSMSRVYIAGPMTGCRDSNYPAFHAAEAMLRSLGYEVENPATAPETPPVDWAGWMRLGIAKMLRCDEVCLLPGWGRSRGAQIEVELAGALGMDVLSPESYLAPVREPKAAGNGHQKPANGVMQASHAGGEDQ